MWPRTNPQVAQHVVQPAWIELNWRDAEGNSGESVQSAEFDCLLHYQLLTGRLTCQAQLHFLILKFVPTEFVIE